MIMHARSARLSNVGQESGRRPKFDPDQRDARAASSSDGTDEHRSFNVTVGEAIRRSRQESFLKEKKRKKEENKENLNIDDDTDKSIASSFTLSKSSTKN